MRVVNLRFENMTAPSTDEVSCNRDDVNNIMTWYGAFYAGDTYSVFLNGQEITQDLNGEMKPLVIDCEAVDVSGFLK